VNQEKFKVNGCDRLQAFIVLFFFLVIFGFFYYVFWAVTGPDTQGMPQGMLDLISLFRKILAPLFALAMFVVCLWCLAPLRTYYTLDPEGIGLHEYTDWGLKAPLAQEIKPWSDIARVGITERGKIRVAFHSRDSIESRWPVAKPGTFESRSRYWHLQQTGRGAHAGPSIQLNNSNVGVFNTGAILNEGSISPIISSVAFQGHTEVANAFKALTEAIAQSNELKETQRRPSKLASDF